MTAILATFLADAVGLRCRLLMARVSSLDEPTRSAVGFGLERLPGRRLFPGGNVAGFTPRGRKRLQGPISVDRLGPPPPSTGVCWCPRPMDGVRLEREGKARRWKRSAGLGHDANVWRRSRHLWRNQHFLLRANLERPLKSHDTSAFPQVRTHLYLPVAIS